MRRRWSNTPSWPKTRWWCIENWCGQALCAAPLRQPGVCALRLHRMKRPVWRCAIISLLLWALPLQWLAAASPPCAGHANAQGEASVLVETPSLHKVQGAPAEPGPAHHHPPQDAHQPHQHHQHHQTEQAQYLEHGESPAHGSMLMVHDVASADSHAQCASAGHCCTSAALLPAALPDFAQRGAAVQCAPLAQPHRTPLLSGLDRPPQTHSV